MTQKKRKSKSKDVKSLEELIKKSGSIRKNIETIMAAFKRIEKHINEMQKNVKERGVRQQAMSSRLEEMMKSMKEIDNKFKFKN